MKTRTAIKEYFEAGDLPTAAQFDELIDSLRHLWEDYTWVGETADTSTIPTVTTRQIFYFASEAGTYTNFGSLVVYPGELCALKLTVNPLTGLGAWSKKVLLRMDDLVVSTQIYGNNLMQANDASVYTPASVKLACETTANVPTYQWQHKPEPGEAWSACSGETAATLTFDEGDADIWDGYTYVLIRCKVTDSQGNIFYSNIINCQLLTDLT